MDRAAKQKFQTLRDTAWPQQLSYFDRMIAAESTPTTPEICIRAREQLVSGGKRIRAILPLLVREYLLNSDKELTNPKTINKNGYDNALWLGLSIEVMHSATLCHDDILDQDAIRHDLPTLWASHGLDTALYCGDLMIFLSEQAIHESKLGDAHKLKALNYLSSCLRRVIYGQTLELSIKENKSIPTPEQITQIFECKTGGLFSLALVFGGIAAGLSTEGLTELSTLGKRLGIAFQTQDDVIDLLGTKGKGVPLADLWESKPSWLVAYAGQKLGTSAKKQLSDLLGIERSKKTQADIDSIYKILKDTGALDSGRIYVENLSSGKHDFLNGIESQAGLAQTVLKLFQQPLVEPNQPTQNLKKAG